MKFFFVLLSVFFLTSPIAAQNPLCQACSPFFTVPTTWDAAQYVLKFACGKLGPATTPCEGLVMAADLSSSYSNMYPHIMTIKDIGCKKYCA